MRFAGVGSRRTPGLQAGVRFAGVGGRRMPGLQAGVRFAGVGGRRMPGLQAGVRLAGVGDRRMPGLQAGVRFAGVGDPGMSDSRCLPASRWRTPRAVTSAARGVSCRPRGGRGVKSIQRGARGPGSDSGAPHWGSSPEPSLDLFQRVVAVGAVGGVGNAKRCPSGRGQAPDVPQP